MHVLKRLFSNVRQMQLEKEDRENEDNPQALYFWDGLLLMLGLKFINVVRTVHGQCVVHSSQITGKASSHSLLQRITWPNRRKVVTGINSENKILDMT